MEDSFEIAGKKFTSRLLVGTGKYKDFAETKLAIESSGAEIVTVALHRVNITDKNQEKLQDYIDPKKYTYLPNTAFCRTADEAVRSLKLARDIGGWDLVKVEVFGDDEILYPDMIETIKATEKLVKEGFKVMVYSSNDPVMCKKIEKIGAAAIMPLAAPIGSGLGIQNMFNLRRIVAQSNVPVLVDAGVGAASDAAIAMENGCEAVLINTAIAQAKHPIEMAQAMKLAVKAGRLSYLAGRIPKKDHAVASSPSIT
ncbi:MAG: thiazole synthase [Rickettsiaceae bacterium H1]|nr:thiazole synthase [Rickettsiaceae bacterium H1]